MSENVLGNEAFINRLVRKETNIATKVLNKVKDLIHMFQRMGNAEARAEYKFLKKAEQLYLNAAESAGFTYVNRQLVDLKDEEENKEVDNSSETRGAYKVRGSRLVTERDFYHHYWVAANNLLSKNELGILDAAVGGINNGERYFQNSDGFYMIPVGENGINNKIVFTDGKRKSYSIDTIVEISLNNETELSIERGNIYASESKGIHTKANELLKVYYAKDYRFGDFKRKVDSGLQNSNGKQDRTRSGGKSRFSLKEKIYNDEYITEAKK